MVTLEAIANIIRQIKDETPPKPSIHDKDAYFEYMRKRLEYLGMKRYALAQFFDIFLM